MMTKLPLIADEKLSCDSCISTKQMKASSCCTLKIVKQDEKKIPECFININNVSQSERNFLTCPTYNLGLYEVCNSCPLECIKNPKQRPNSSLREVINLVGNVFGIDEQKKKDINNSFEKLNQPEFKEAYSSLERASNSIKNIMNGKLGSSDIAKKVLQVETENLKKSFDGLVKNGKISEDEARMMKIQINSSANMEKLKSLLNTMKKNK